jgi:GDP-L-fucose synthase
MTAMAPESRIYIAGHRGLAGSALVRGLTRTGYSNLITRTHAQLELRDKAAVGRFFAEEKPEYVLLAAAHVGGIHANFTQPVPFLLNNLEIQNNVIAAAQEHGAKRLLFLGSSCIYPRMAAQPIEEASLLTGPLEFTNQPYAIAKIAGIELCHAFNRQYGTKFIAAMPTNLYGVGDNYHPQNSHVLPALLRKVHEAMQSGRNEVTIWGTGTPRREFLYSDDFAEACIHLLGLDDAQYGSLLDPVHPPIINIGSSTDLTIRELAETICRILGFKGELRFDASKPDGTPRKLMDSSRIRSLGWKPRIDLESGIRLAYEDARKHFGAASR